MIERIELPFGKFDIYERYVVGEPDFGVNMGIEEASIILDRVASRFNRPWGYIGNRINANSVDPFAYHFAKKTCDQFQAIAIIAGTSATRQVAMLERHFAERENISFSIFEDLEVAKRWLMLELTNSED